MKLTAEQVESIENIIRGAMVPVARNGYAGIEMHAVGATSAIVEMLGRES